jgi:hypothetical protein
MILMFNVVFPTQMADALCLEYPRDWWFPAFGDLRADGGIVQPLLGAQGVLRYLVAPWA